MFGHHSEKSDAGQPLREHISTSPSKAVIDIPHPRHDGAFNEWIASLLQRLIARMNYPSVTLIDWDGRTLHDGGQQTVGTIRILKRPPIWPLLMNPQLWFAENYIDGKIAIEGDLKRVMLTLFQSVLHADVLRAGGLFSWLHKYRRNTLKRSQHNVEYHYDLGNDFYRLWLDERLLYTCAYFPHPLASLEVAQIAKMDRVCHKLWLKPGEQVIEAGCGWGSLAMHMAKTYHVKVTAYNISREQIMYARERARDEQLEHLVTFVEDDWRNISGTCDAFVSVGMLEHVGKENYSIFGRVIRHCLSEHGRGLIHSIGRNRP